MATHTIRKSSQAGIGYSVVELNDVRHVFAAAVPRRGLTLRQQADDALRTIEAVIQEEGTRGSIVHQAVFVPNVNLIDECRQIIRDFYGKEMPATSYIPQPPCEGKLLAIEALGIGRGTGRSRDRAGQRAIGHRPAQPHRLVPLCGGRSPERQRQRLRRLAGRLPANSRAVGQRQHPVRPGDPHLALPGRDRRGRRTHAALQGTQPRTDRLLPGHPLSRRPLAARPPGHVPMVGGSFRPARASAPRAAA